VDTGSEAAGGEVTASFTVWIDAQLPPALARWLHEGCGVEALHVLDLGLLKTSDEEIFVAARQTQQEVVIFTKDDDFPRLLRRHGAPPRIVWIRSGNVRNSELRRIVLEAWSRTAEFLVAGEPLVEIRARPGA